MCSRRRVEIGKDYHEAQRKGQSSFFSPTNEWCLPAPSILKPKEIEFVVESLQSMQMLSRKDLNSAELKTVRVFKSPATVVVANGELQTKEEATVYVKELDLFVTVKLLQDTLAVLSLGKLCEDHGHSYHWTSGQKPQLIKDGRRIKCSTENYVPIVVPGLSNGSSSSATPTSPTSVPQEAAVPTLHPAPTRSESTSSTVRGSPSHDLPEWSAERRILWMKVFQLEGTHPRVLLVSQLQSREEKVISGKHSIYTPFPKNRNCDIRMRTKVTRAPCSKRTGAAVPRAEIFW